TTQAGRGRRSRPRRTGLPAGSRALAWYPRTPRPPRSQGRSRGRRGPRQRTLRATRLPPLQLLLHFLGFFLNLLAALLDVLAHARHRVARTERERGRQRGETIDKLSQHGSPFAIVEIMMTFATQ